MAQELFVSGRLCLFGEHSDWAGQYRSHNPAILEGKTLVVGTKEGLYAKAQADKSQVLTVTVSTSSGDTLGPRTFKLEAQSLLEEAQKGGFWSYIAGTAYRILVNHRIGGLVLDNYRTTLPMGKGLSSSAAICVLVARAFNLAYDLKLTTRGEMELAFLGEVTTPSKCGRMDQGCAYGSIPIVMTFDADLLHVETVKLKAPLYLVLVDLCASKDTTTILTALQAAYPRATSDGQQRLHELLGPVNQQIVQRALAAMADGDAPALGALMREAQERFDAAAAPLCPSQLAAPVLHTVLGAAALAPLVWGAKGVGSQGDGTAQLLCKGPAEQAQACELLTSQFGMQVMALTLDATV